jgi:hypothetical protein
MKTSFITTIVQDKDVNATGIQVPAEIIESLASGKKPKIKVTLNGFTYRTTVAVMGGVFMIPLSAEHRAASRVKGGESLEVGLELDTEPRTIEIPNDLAKALSQISGATEQFDKLAFSKRKEYVRQVESAKAQETRERRIAGIVTKIIGG